MEHMDIDDDPVREFADFVTDQEWDNAAQEVLMVAGSDVIAAWSRLAPHAGLLDQNVDAKTNAHVLAQVFSAVNKSSPTVADALAVELAREFEVGNSPVVDAVLTELYTVDADLAGRWRTVLHPVTHAFGLAQAETQAHRAHHRESPQAHVTHLQNLAAQDPYAAVAELWDIPRDGRGLETQIVALLEGMDPQLATNILIAARQQIVRYSYPNSHGILLAMQPVFARQILAGMYAAQPQITGLVVSAMSDLRAARSQTAALLAGMDPKTAGDILIAAQKVKYSFPDAHGVLPVMDPAAANSILTAMDPAAADWSLTKMATADLQATSQMMGAMGANSPGRTAALLGKLSPQTAADLLAAAQQSFPSQVNAILTAMAAQATEAFRAISSRLGQ